MDDQFLVNHPVYLITKHGIDKLQNVQDVTVRNMLLTLEISIALIQAYVFSILLTLYFSESN